MPIIRVYANFERPRRRKRRVEFVIRMRNPAVAGQSRQEALLQPVQRLELNVHRKTRLELLTPAACAKELGYSESRVIQLIRAGKLPARKFGRVFLVLDDDLEAYVRARRQQVEKLKLDYRRPDKRTRATKQ